MAEAVLEGIGLARRFGGAEALRSGEIALKAGEMHTLVGKNGAGKSTLARILAGAIPPDEGELRFQGAPVAWTGPRHALDSGVSAVLQTPRLCPGLTAADNIFLGRLPRTRFGMVDRKRLHEEARRLLNRLQAPISPGSRVDTLSAAQRQAVAFAQALARPASVLILDEPASALNEAETASLRAVLREIKARGTAVLYITDRLDDIPEMCDRITVLRDGETVATGPVSGWDFDNLLRYTAGRTLESPFPRSRPPAREVILEARGLSVSPILSDISLTVSRHEIVGLTGPVGSGKSALARALYGLTPPEDGMILMGGEPVALRSPRDAVLHGLAYMPEDRLREGVLPEMSVSDNVTLSVIHGLSDAGRINRPQETFTARFWVERLGIQSPHLGQPARDLSGGNQQKVLLARGVATRPYVMILDEPTRGVDVWARAQMRLLIDELAREGTGILLISSDLSEILGMCDGILVMREGRIAARFDNRNGDSPVAMEALRRAVFGVWD
ncbi:MAG: sugar ABC transporter ATP-binding protein [Armatimonadetes bacterium]|nr:sugar ABC transporter ATP-binding protein [Armatimonadota bacterium]